MAHITPKIPENDRVKVQTAMTDELLKDIEKQIANAPKASLVAAGGGMDPLTRMTRK